MSRQLVLVLPGVKHDPACEDPVADLLEKEIREGLDDDPPDAEPPVVMQRNPSVFRSVEEWPSKSGFGCWSCTLEFDGPPRFIPDSFAVEDDEQYNIQVLGNFCTFSCAARYIEDRFSREMRGNALKNLSFLRKIVTGNANHKVAPSPPHTEMVQFGGALSVEEFREKVRALNDDGSLRPLVRVIPERERPSAAAPRPAPRVSVWKILSGPLGLTKTGAASAEPPAACATGLAEPPAASAGASVLADADELDEILRGLGD